MKKSNKQPIEHQTWKVRGSPTPSETLMVCDGCHKSEWTTGIHGRVYHCNNCTGRKGGYLRMRKATKAEIAEAKKQLKEII